MPLPDNDSSVAYSFGLEIDGIQIKAITEVTGLKMEQEVIEYSANTAADGKPISKKLPGRAKTGECTLTRALTDDQSFDKWVTDSRLGKMGQARKNGAIVVYDYEGNPIKRYKLTAAWPKGIEISTLKAGDNNWTHETLHLTYENLEAEGA